MRSLEQKRSLGQYFTHGNPFHAPPFKAWMALFWTPQARILEPFAGANHIVRLIREAGWEASWACCDIQPPSPTAEGFEVATRDTLKSFPAGFTAAITNPPYLARNSAVRRQLAFPATRHNDLYKVALERMLKKVPYVAAIIPESFLTAGLFHDRLVAAVSLTSKMFEDTAHPVCLALFVPAAQKSDRDFEIWDNARLLGRHHALSAMLPTAKTQNPWRFNDPTGTIGLHALDGTSGPGIRFVKGGTIPAKEVKTTSRAVSRIGGSPVGFENEIIARANRWVERYRSETHDTLMTAFKGLRKDGRYRRRLDFAQARCILDLALEESLATGPQQVV